MSDGTFSWYIFHFFPFLELRFCEFLICFQSSKQTYTKSNKKHNKQTYQETEDYEEGRFGL